MCFIQHPFSLDALRCLINTRCASPEGRERLNKCERKKKEQKDGEEREGEEEEEEGRGRAQSYSPARGKLGARGAAYRRCEGNDAFFYDSVKIFETLFGIRCYFLFFLFFYSLLTQTRVEQICFLGSVLSSPAFFSSGENEAAADRSHMLPRCSALQRCQAGLKE